MWTAWAIVVGLLVILAVAFVAKWSTSGVPPAKKGCNSCPKSKQNVV